MPKPTLASLTKENAGLKRAVRGLEKDVRTAEKSYENSLDKYEVVLTGRTDARKKAEEWKSKFHAIELEAARLSGYVNRVEVLDHANWHARHGIVQTRGPKEHPDINYVQPLYASSFTIPF